MGQILSRAIAAAVALGFAAGSAAAQTDFPQRAITLIVPFAAGGPTDVVARIAGDHMTRTLGQPVIIENVVGAGGTTASTRAARATPDGYTIEMVIWEPTPPRSRSIPTLLTSRMWTLRPSAWWPVRRS